MMDSASVTIIGFGNVGRTLFRSLKHYPHRFSVQAIGNSKGIHNFNSDDNKINTDLTFLCVPTQENGKVELEHVKDIMSCSGRVAVTCAKGMAAQHYEYVDEHKYRIGISATVGSGCGMVPMIRNFRREEGYSSIKELNGVVNGSLNYIWNRMSEGISLQEILFETIEKGFTESGNLDALSVIRQEINDARLKSAILANSAFYPDELVRGSDIVFANRSTYESSIIMATKNPERVRFAVQITKGNSSIDDKLFNYRGRSYEIAGGFVPIERLPRELITPYENNCLVIQDYNGKFKRSLTLPGASANQTATMMIADARKLLSLPSG